MLFTTQVFTFGFFPLCMVVYYLAVLLEKKTPLAGFLKKCRFTDLALIGISSLFYLWACFDDLFRFGAYIVLVYLFGKLLQRGRRKNFCLIAIDTENTADKKLLRLSLPIFAVSIAIIVGLLIHYKYTGLLAETWNFLTNDTLSGKSIMAPLGISFITFSAISYLADIYMGKEEAGSLIDCALYLSFFPKVVSGPIVLWRDFRGQIAERKISLTLLAEGMSRIMIGFAKKLILADTFGACVASASTAIDTPTSWGIALLYMLQIYYDFSGYSDIAIGLSNMLGFSIKENFNFPYISCSITEFWRRWHISLGTWFREYIYFPLGGSRRGKKRALINVAIVFLLTGIWHGAGWTYMLWGIINGACNIIEKLIADRRWYQKTPKILKWGATMAVTFFCWELFRFTEFTPCLEWFKIMLGQGNFASIPYTWEYYFDLRIIALAVVGILGSTLFGLPKVQQAYQWFKEKPYGYIIHQLIIVALFVVSILFMINSTYSPFIYFQY